MILSYIKHWVRAGDEHSVHSPFVYQLYTEAIKDGNWNYDGTSELTELSRLQKRSKEKIEVLDLGAGSRVSRSNVRSIGEIARNAEKPERFGKLFYRLARYSRAKNVVELGTSLGISTLWFSRSVPEAEIFTFEGCPQTLRVAEGNFRKISAYNIQTFQGNIDQTLLPALQKMQGPLDLAYLDANHRYEPTLRYFTTCLPFIQNDTMFIFDDIYWSSEMKKAWNEIKSHPSVRVTIDLFWVGLVFFRKEQERQHFVLRL